MSIGICRKRRLAGIPILSALFWILVAAINPASAQSSISFVNSTSFTSGGNVTSFAVSVPAGVQNGDLLLASTYHGADPDPVITMPPGWMQLYQDSSTSGGKHTVFYRIAGSSEPASYTWQLSNSKNVAAGMVAYRGVNSLGPFHAQTSGNVEDATSISLEITTTIAETQLVILTAWKAATPGATPDGSMAERYDVAASVRSLNVADEALTSMGATTRSVTVDDPGGASSIFALAVALLPDNASNLPPFVDPVEDRLDFEGDSVDLQVTALDLDDDTLGYSASGLPAGLSIGASDGRITGSIDAGAATGSPYAVDVMVDDGVHPPVEIFFSWHVKPSTGPINLVGATSSTNLVFTTSFDVDVPFGVQAGDLLLTSTIHGNFGTPSITPEPGWTLLYQDSSADGGKHSVFYKFAGPSEPDSYNWQISELKHPGAGMVAYRGVETTAPFHAQVTGDVVSAPSISLNLTTTVDETRLVMFTGLRAASAGATAGAGLTERYEGYGPPRTVEMADEILPLAGTFMRTVSVDDAAGGEEIFALAVALLPDTTPNLPPVVSPVEDQIGFEGETVDLQIVATDVDFDPLSYSASGLPPGLSIGASDGRITGSIDVGAAAGSPYAITVEVGDGVGLPVETSFAWTVSPAAAIPLVGVSSFTSGSGTVPSFVLDLPPGAQEGDFLIMSMYHGASPDPTITVPAGWMQLYQDATAGGGKHSVFYKFAGPAEPASYTWQLSHSKNVAAGMSVYRGVKESAPVHAMVTGHELSAASIMLEITTSVPETRLLVFTASKAAEGGVTPDGDLIERYDISAAARTAAMADEPLYAAGTLMRTMTIDAAGGADEIFAVAVALLPASVSNVPPTVDPVADQSGYDGDSIDLQIVAADGDEDILAYAASGLPPGLGIGAVDGRITGTIDAGASAGSPYAVTVMVSDGVNPATETSFAWTVSSPPSGPLPLIGLATFSSGSDQVSSFALDVPAGVMEGDLMIMSMFHGASPDPAITPPPGWMELYQDASASSGKHTVYYAFAGTMLPSSFTWQLSVAKNVAAGLAVYRGVNIVAPFQAMVTGNELSVAAISLEITAAVPDSRLLMFTASKAGSTGVTPEVTMSERYDLSAGPRNLGLADELLSSAGTVMRSVAADDLTGAEEFFALAVILLPDDAPNQPPMISAVADQPGFEGDPVDLQIIATDFDGDVLTYAASGLPPGLSIGPSTGRITGAISAGATTGSPYAVTVAVDDGINPPVEEGFSWTVNPAPAIPLVGATGWSTGDTLSSTIPLDVPAGVQDGDLLIATMYHGASPDPTITAPAGWTLIYQDSSTDAGKHSVYYRFAGPSEPASYTWHLSTQKHPAGGMVAYRGVEPAAPFHAQVTGHELNAMSISLEITSTIAESRLVMMTAFKSVVGGGTAEGGLVERYDEFAYSRTAHLADEPVASMGMVSRSVTIDDPGGATEIFAFGLLLCPIDTSNSAPSVDPVADQQGFEGDPVDLQIVATDGDVLSYSASGLPPGLSIGMSDGRITGTLSAGGAAGSPYAVTVTVSDGVNPGVDVPFGWTVSEPAAISLVGATSFTTGDTLTSIIPLDVPAGVQEGDLLMASMYHGANPDAAITAPAGWTILYQDSTTPAGKHTVYYRFAGPSEPGSYSWQLSNQKHPAGGMAAYRGVDAAAPFHALVTGHELNTTSISLDVTTTIAESRLVMFTAFKSTSGGGSTLGGLSERYDEFAFSRTAYMADEELASMGTVTRGVAVDDAGGAVELFALAVALKPDSLPAGPVAALEPEVVITGGTIEISWPTTPPGYALWTSTTMLPGSWSLVPDAPVVSGTNYVVTLPITGLERFYRLEK